MKLQKQKRVYGQYCPHVVRLISLITICVGISVLIGWYFNIILLTHIVTAWNSMKVNTAICFILSGTALFLTQQKSDLSMISPVSVILAMLVMLISGLTLYEYSSGLSLGIDDIFFPANLLETRPHDPQRMVVLTAINLCLVGTAIVLINVKKSNPWIHQSLAWLIYMIAFFSLCNYIFGLGPTLYPSVLVTPIAFHSTILFLLLSFAILISRLDVGIIAILFDDDMVGKILRVALPFILTVPVFIVTLENMGTKAGFYNDKFGDSIDVVGSIAVFTIVFAILGYISKKEQSKRITTEIKLHDTEILLSEFSKNTDAVFYKTNVEGDRIIYINPAFEKIWGYQMDDLYKNPHLWFETILPEDKEAVKELFFDKIQHVPKVEVEYRIKR